MIPHHNKPPRKVYSITGAGRQELQEWVNQPITNNPSLKAFVMRLTLASSFSQARLVAHLQQRRNQVTAHHIALEQTVKALDHALALPTAELAWLDSTLKRLAESALQPPPMEVVKSI